MSRTQLFVRATSIIARTVYRELRKAGYSQQDVLRFINEVVDLLTQDSKREGGDVVRQIAAVADAITGLPNEAAITEVIEFELKRAQSIGAGATLQLMRLDVQVAESLTDDRSLELHSLVTNMLRKQVRSGDAVGRLSPTSYVVVLPQSTLDAPVAIASRLERELMRHRRHDDEAGTLGSQLRIEMRTVRWTPAIESTAALLACCEEVPVRVLPTNADPQEPASSGRGAEQPSVVLALGGGAARALAHIGAIRVLEEAGVRIAGVAGTSAGALVGAMYASGMKPNEILERFQALANSPLYRKLRRAWVSHRPSRARARTAQRYFRESSLGLLSESEVAAISSELYEDLISFFIGSDREISELAIPFACCATDLVEGRSEILSHGPLHQALRASCAIPGMFPPENDGGRVFVDGAIIWEVPILAGDELRRRVDAPILAVYLARPPRRVEGFASSLELAVRANAVVHTQLVREQLRTAPILLTLPVQDVVWFDFQQSAQIVAIGETTARKEITALQEQIVRLQKLAVGKRAS